jgi:death on curing protein
MKTPNYLVVEDALSNLAVAVRLSGGSAGVRDEGVLVGCLERPKAEFGGKEMYRTLFEKSAVYIDSIARNHPFIDGNKRTAFLCGARFLNLNGYDLDMQQNVIVDGMLWVVTDHPEIQEIARWIKKHSKKQK